MPWLLAAALLLLALPSWARPGDCSLLERTGVQALDAAAIVAEPVAFPFAPGERLEYAVSYFGIEVGRASVEVKRFVAWHGRRLAHVVGTARTNRFFSVFYRVDDRTEAWIDVDTLRTHRTATHTRHGPSREIYEEVEFDWKAHYVRIFEARRHRGDALRLEFDFGPFVNDTFDALYALRASPLAVGSTVTLPVYASQKVYELSIAVTGREPIRSPVLGEIDALVVRPSNRLDGASQDDGRGKVWVSADPRHIPVRAHGWLRSTQGLRIGGLRAELVAYHPPDPGYPAAPSIQAPEPPLPVRTVDGRPEWTPPPALAKRRARNRIHHKGQRYRFDWPAGGIGCPESPAPDTRGPLAPPG